MRIINGKNNPMFGKSLHDVWSEKYGKEIADKKLQEMKLKMSIVHLGSKRNQIVKQKMSKKRKEYLQTHPEEIEKMRERRTGKNNPMFGKPSWNKGKHLSKEHIKKLSKPKTKEHKEKLSLSAIVRFTNKENHPCFGKHLTEETKIKQSQAKNGKIPFTKKIVYNNIIFRSNWEAKYAKFLDKNKIPYEYEPNTFNVEIFWKGNIVTRQYTPDFYLLNTHKYKEIKGLWRNEGLSKLKFEAFKKQYPNWDITLINNTHFFNSFLRDR
jgi:hypothetical protein